MKLAIEFDERNLTYTDEYLAALWHGLQFNTAPNADPESCQAVELVGREIIRRWLEKTPAPLWRRQGVHEIQLSLIDKDAKVRNVLSAARALIKSALVKPEECDDKELGSAIEDLTKALIQIET